MRRILFLALAALLALMPVSVAYAGGGEDDRDRERIKFEDIDGVDIQFDFRPFRIPTAEIEIAPGVEIEVPFFTALSFLLSRNLGALGLFNVQRLLGLQDRLGLPGVRGIQDIRDLRRDR